MKKVFFKIKILGGCISMSQTEVKLIELGRKFLNTENTDSEVKVEPETKYDDFVEEEDELIGGTEEQKTSIDKSEQQKEQIEKEVINLKEEKQVAKPCKLKETIKDIDSLTVEELIKELNTYRFKNGISQLSLAKELNLSITTVNN